MKRMALFLILVGLMGCAPTAQQQADYAEAQRQGVASATYEKLVRGHALYPEDVKELARKKVSDGVVIRHLYDTRAVYRLSTQQVDDLRRNGVSDAVINVMLESPKYLEQALREEQLRNNYSVFDEPYYYRSTYRRPPPGYHYHR